MICLCQIQISYTHYLFDFPSFFSPEFLNPDKHMSQEEVGKLCNNMEEENRVSFLFDIK